MLQVGKHEYEIKSNAAGYQWQCKKCSESAIRTQVRLIPANVLALRVSVGMGSNPGHRQDTSVLYTVLINSPCESTLEVRT